MKVFVHFEEHENKDVHKTSKLTLPKSWKEKELGAVLKLFVDSYNKKFEANQLDFEQVHLCSEDGKTYATSCGVEKYVTDGMDLYVKHGASPSEAEMTATAVDGSSATPPAPPATTTAKPAPTASSASSKPGACGVLQCKRFGCQLKYDPNNNPEGSCCYHRLPPVFHETAKFWACCPEKKCYSWDSFMKVKGCMTGRHTDEKPDQPSVLGGCDVRAGNDGSESQQKLKSIEEYNAERQQQGGGAAGAIARMYQLRQALDKAGVPGELFDSAKDNLMKKLNDDHEAVSRHINDQFVNALHSMASE